MKFINYLIGQLSPGEEVKHAPSAPALYWYRVRLRNGHTQRVLASHTDSARRMFPKGSVTDCFRDPMATTRGEIK